MRKRAIIWSALFAAELLAVLFHMNIRNDSREYNQDRNRIREDAVMLTKERKKQLDTDLWIIAGVSILVLVIYTVFGREIDNIAVDTEIPIVLRTGSPV